MLNMAVRNTAKLIREISKNDNRRIGRFFTKKDTARLMADMFTSERSDVATILDPGAGTGILSAAVCEKLARDGVGDLYLTCYETDPMFLPMLYDNLERIRKSSVTISTRGFITRYMKRITSYFQKRIIRSRSWEESATSSTIS